MKNGYYILKGKKLVYLPADANNKNLLKWAEWFETANRRVAFTKVGRKNVSTVFLGIDHNFGKGKPILFETMIFPKSEETERYHTWDEAVKGHKKIIRRLKVEIKKRKKS